MKVKFEFNKTAYPNSAPLELSKDSRLVKNCPFFTNQVIDWNMAGGDTVNILPDCISPESIKYIEQWAEMMDDTPSDNEDGDDPDEIQNVINSYLPAVFLTNFETHFFKRMGIASVLNLMTEANYLGCRRLVDHIGRYMAKFIENKTPDALRRIFGVPDSIYCKSEAEEKEWLEKYGWCLIGATDDKGEQSDMEEED